MSRTWLNRETTGPDGVTWYHFNIESFDEVLFEEIVEWCRTSLTWSDCAFGEHQYYAGPGATHYVMFRGSSNAMLFKLTFC